MNGFAKNSFILSAAFITFACSSNEFRSSPKKPQVETTTVQIGCDAQTGVSNVITDLVGLSGSKVVAKGEFCSISLEAVPADPLNILFVLDFSGSMRWADEEISDSCGRLKAAQQLVANFEAQVAQKTAAGQKMAPINMGLVTFGTRAEVSVPMTTMTNFRSSLTARNFCGENMSATNYDDAFYAADQALNQVKGPKVVYFVSDGFPSASGNSSTGIDDGFGKDATHRDKGRAAAQAFRSKDTSIVLNALFLEIDYNRYPTAPKPSASDPNPRTYLAEITGDASRVVVASSASQLAAQMASLAVPEAPLFETQGVTSELTAVGFSSRQVAVKPLVRNPNATNHWLFETQPIQLFGRVGQIVENRIVVRARSSDGKTPEAVAIIKFNQK